VATNLDCELCAGPGGELLWEDGLCRVVRVAGAEGAAFPGYCRVVCQRHIAEMSALTASDAHRVMDVVLATERALRPFEIDGAPVVGGPSQSEALPLEAGRYADRLQTADEIN